MVAYIDDHRDVFGVESICGVLPIAPSTYYAAKRRELQPSDRASRDAVMMPVLLALWITANISSGNNRDRCSAKNESTVPAGTKWPTNAAASNNTGSEPDCPCMPTVFFTQHQNACLSTKELLSSLLVAWLRRTGCPVEQVVQPRPIPAYQGKWNGVFTMNPADLDLDDIARRMSRYLRDDAIERFIYTAEL